MTITATSISDCSDQNFWGDAKHNRCSGHAIAIIGFDADVFIFINSWGMKWGECRYGRLPYKDFDKAYEYWYDVLKRKTS